MALSLADSADAITARRFEKLHLEVSKKSDNSLVTAVDLKVEETLRQRLQQLCPRDSMIGEESGQPPPSDRSGRTWIIDPLDHTNNYVRGIPDFATLIALEEDGVLSVGVVSAPRLRMRWWASRNEGAFANGKPIHVSSVTELSESYLTFAAIDVWEQRGLAASVAELASSTRCTHGSGGFWGQMLVAEGRLDISLDPWGEPWDLAASALIVAEAGGRFSDLGGQTSIDHESAVVTNSLLHDQVLSIMNSKSSNH